jgi:hypothetical protein
MLWPISFFRLFSEKKTSAAITPRTMAAMMDKTGKTLTVAMPDSGVVVGAGAAVAAGN